MLEDAAYRRLIDAYYTKEAPLPADRKACHRLARATSKSERDAVDTILDEFFTLADDGWHQSRCDAELAKYIEKRPAAEEKRENDKKRQHRARERRKQLFEELSNHGINMPWNATTEMLQVELSRVTSNNKSQSITESVTCDNTATHSPLPTPHSPLPRELSSVVDSQPESRDPSPENATRKGLLCRQLRSLGIDAAPHLQGWAELLPAYSDAEIIAAAEQAREKKPGERLHLNYLIPFLRDRKAPIQGTAISSGSARKSRIDNYAAQAAAARDDHGTDNRPDGDDRIIDGEIVRVV